MFWHSWESLGGAAQGSRRPRVLLSRGKNIWKDGAASEGEADLSADVAAFELWSLAFVTESQNVVDVRNKGHEGK